MVNPFYSKEDYENVDRTDEIAGVRIDISKSLSEILNASLQGMWERQEFQPVEEEVIRYSIGGTLDYMLSRSITTSVGYRYNNRDSDLDDSDDFHNNIVWLQGKVNF